MRSLANNETYERDILLHIRTRSNIRHECWSTNIAYTLCVKKNTFSFKNLFTRKFLITFVLIRNHSLFSHHTLIFTFTSKVGPSDDDLQRYRKKILFRTAKYIFAQIYSLSKLSLTPPNCLPVDFVTNDPNAAGL